MRVFLFCNNNRNGSEIDLEKVEVTDLLQGELLFTIISKRTL